MKKLLAVLFSTALMTTSAFAHHTGKPHPHHPHHHHHHHKHGTMKK